MRISSSTQCKSHLQPTLLIGAAERMVSALSRAVTGIRPDDQRLAKENLLNLGLRDSVLFVLASIAGIPVEADDAGQVHGSVYVRHIQKERSLTGLVHRRTGGATRMIVGPPGAGPSRRQTG